MGWRIIASSLVLLALESSAGVLPQTKLHPEARLLTHGDVYKLNPDGTYSYRYDLSDGTFHHVRSEAIGDVIGGYGYSAPNGEDFKVDYVSGIKGYQPKLTSSKSHNVNSDASYAFGYSSHETSRTEYSDENGNIHGQYTLTNNNGESLIVRYMAGAKTGFVIENAEELALFVERSTLSSVAYKKPVAAAVKAEEHAEVHFKDGDINPEDWKKYKSYSFGYESSTGLRKEEADDNGNVRGKYTLFAADGSEIIVHYRAGANIGFVIENMEEVMAKTAMAAEHGNNKVAEVISTYNHEHAKPLPLHHVEENKDASYSFRFEEDSNTRHESADKDGNVLGSYTYVDPNGNRIRVEYKAGKGGFEILNKDELDASLTKARETYEEKKTHVHKTHSFETTLKHHHEEPKETYKPYSFNVEAESGNHNQEADAEGNVRGEYMYVNSIGHLIRVKYMAGPSIGFVILNQEELDKAVHKTTIEAGKLAAANAYAAPKPVHTVGVVNVETKAEDVSYKPYSFQIDGEFRKHHEFADAEGNVKGEYSYTNALGRVIRVEYKAGPTIGFVILNQEELDKAVLETTVEAGKVAETKLVKAHETYTAPKPVTPEVYTTVHHNHEVHEKKEVSYKPYSFNIAGETRMHNEKADAEGNVEGEYSYTNELGHVIRVEYKAGPSIGFVVLNQEELDQAIHKTTIEAGKVAASKPKPVEHVVVKEDHHANLNTYSHVKEEASYKPYSFETGNRQEHADGKGNVRGEYSYTNELGHLIRVEYMAGPTIGFVVLNKEELDKTVEKTTLEAAHLAKKTEEVKVHEPVNTNTYHAHEHKPEVKLEEEKVEYRPYAFRFEDAESKRHEEADNNGNVFGEYSYRNAEGNMIHVQYKAGPSIGFVILNQEQLDESIHKATLDAAHKVKKEEVATSYTTKEETPKETYTHHEVSHKDEANYKPYSFNVEGFAGNHKQQADANGNVEGEYSYTNAEGNLIRVKYMAGPTIGFVILNQEELDQSIKKVNHEVAPKPYIAEETEHKINRAHASSNAHVFFNEPTQYTAYTAANAEAVNKHEEAKEEYSTYKFNYDDESSHRDEEGDDEGTVKGEYSYTNEFGNEIKVKYSAGPNTGFVIENKDELDKSVKEAIDTESLHAAKTAEATSYKAQTATLRHHNHGHAPAQAVEPLSPVHGFPVVKKVVQTPELSFVGANGHKRKLVLKKKRVHATPVQYPVPVLAHHPVVTLSQYTSFPAYATPVLSTADVAFDASADHLVESYSTHEASNNADAHNSYSFAYSSNGNSREEMSDANGERTGSYSYTSPEGHQIVYKYKAGKNGFEIVNPHTY